MKYTFRALADNYATPRGFLRGTVETGQGADGRSDILVFEAIPRHACDALYILDFGDRVEVRYVAGWQPWDGDRRPADIWLQEFPLSVGTRPDNGRAVFADGWMFGPRRAYHLKLTEVSE